MQDKDLIEAVRNALACKSNEKNRLKTQRFFKEKLQCHGTQSAVTTEIAKEYFEEIKSYNKKEVFNLCEFLWQSGFLEEVHIACEWVYKFKKQYDPSDFKIFERWGSLYINNWASCDKFCTTILGTFIINFPDLIVKLLYWAGSSNPWVRRAAAVAFILPARRGLFLEEILKIADIMLLDKDDMVLKGYGWMLKVASTTHLDTIFDFIFKRKDFMPRTALRYAIEKMPTELKQKAMSKG